MNIARPIFSTIQLLLGSLPKYYVSYAHRVMSLRSAIGLAALFLGIAGLFGYMYFQEWRFRRSFERLAGQGTEHEWMDSQSSPAPLRESLVKQRPAKANSPSSTPAPQTGSASNRLASQPSPAPSSILSSHDSNARRGVVQIQGDDALSEIFVDGRFFGGTPAKLKLSEGSHRIEVKRTGVVQYTRELVVAADSVLTLYPLAPKADTAIPEASSVPAAS
jgi:hypothetical protein